MSENTEEKIFVRIIELPKVKAARSGQGNLDAFDRWWSAIEVNPQSDLHPRDFMWFNPQLNDLEWLYFLPEDLEDAGGYEVFEFPGGLYAVAACKDEESEIERTGRLIHQWVAQSDIFQVDPNVDTANPRYEMGHVITPKNAKDTIGYHQMDLYVPIV
jgi:hypothetical protein